MTHNADAESAYFDWMVDKAGGWRQRRLLGLLHETPFSWTIDKDANRADDGAYQRWLFYEETGIVVDGLDAPRGSGCSVLELLLGLADAVDDIMYEPDNGSCPQIWFQTILENMGIGYLNDTCFHEYRQNSVEEADSAVEKLLRRTYGKDGEGGPFHPLSKTCKDARKVELWVQMNDFCDQILTQRYSNVPPCE